jgi:hypothetical protein
MGMENPRRSVVPDAGLNKNFHKRVTRPSTCIHCAPAVAHASRCRTAAALPHKAVHFGRASWTRLQKGVRRQALTLAA